MIDILDEIPGIGRQVAQVIIAEIGLDMSRFPTAGHLVSWAKLCPRTIQSGAKTSAGKVWGTFLLVLVLVAAGGGVIGATAFGGDLTLAMKALVSGASMNPARWFARSWSQATSPTTGFTWSDRSLAG